MIGYALGAVKRGKVVSMLQCGMMDCCPTCPIGSADVVQLNYRPTIDYREIGMTGIANEDALPLGLTPEPTEHDAWFRARVREALEDDRPLVADAQVEAHFAKRRLGFMAGEIADPDDFDCMGTE